MALSISISIAIDSSITSGGGPTPATFLLDLYPGAAVAYSLRKLRSAYSGSAIRVRRSSDNAETNIGFVSNQLDTASLLTFCGAGNGFVTNWYDQSGNNKDAIQTTALNQPQIVNSGSVILVNSKPSLQVDINDSLSLTSTFVPIKTTFGVIKRNIGTGNFFIYGGGVSHYYFGSITYYETSNQLSQDNAADITTNQIILSAYNSNSTTLFQYKNNVLQSTSNAGLTRADAITTLFTYNGSLFSDGFCQEVVIYSINNSVNLSDINSNINSYYNIY
jgi:hypothetical protein